MRLRPREKKFVKDNCGKYTDLQISRYLTKVRYDADLDNPVSKEQVRMGRRRMGIKKASGRGICEVITRLNPKNC